MQKDQQHDPRDEDSERNPELNIPKNLLEHAAIVIHWRASSQAENRTGLPVPIRLLYTIEATEPRRIILRKWIALSSLLALVAATAVLAHPHFNKVLKVTLAGGVEATITYGTTPANELNAQKVVAGEFVVPRRPLLKLSADLKTGNTTLPAGDYIIGVIKNSESDWTMALYPGQIPRGEKPDMAKLIKLDSLYTTAMGKSDHMLIDIEPGSGKLENRAVLTIHFGSMFLAGAISEIQK
jgi:hypothetical protein